MQTPFGMTAFDFFTNAQWAAIHRPFRKALDVAEDGFAFCTKKRNEPK